MADDFKSLLSLDSMTGEQSVRLAVYKRAEQFSMKVQDRPDIAETAQAFLDFVGGSAWRLETIDVVVSAASRRSTVAAVLANAQRIADWVQPPKNIPVRRDVSPSPVKKKATTRKV